MAITFDSPQDPFGFQAAGSILAKALMQNGQQQKQNNFNLQRDLLQNEFQIEKDLRNQQSLMDKEARELALKQKFGPLLGDTLSVAYDPNASAQQKSMALSSYLSAGGNISEVTAAYKQLAQESQTASLLSQFGINPIQNQNNLTSPVAISQNQHSQMQAGQELTPQTSSLFEQIPEQAAIAMAASPNQSVNSIGKAVIEAKKWQQSRFESDRKYETQFALPYLKQIDDQRAAVENKLRASEQLQQAIAQGDSGMFSVNNIARIFNRPELLNASGAQLTSAVKELLVSNIGRVGSRPNQWIEQQISLALPDLGKSPIANGVLAEGVKGEVELANQRIQLTDQLAAEDRAKYGYVKGDIASRVDKAIKPYADQINKKAAYRMRELFEQEKGTTYLKKNMMQKVVDGTPITRSMARLFMEKYKDPQKAFDNAQKLGYTIYTNEDLMEIK